MNDHLTISTFQLFQMFPDAESARLDSMIGLVGNRRITYKELIAMKPPRIVTYSDPSKPWTVQEIARAYKVPLDRVVDTVLAHKPKAKSKPARKRARRAKKIAQAADA